MLAIGQSNFLQALGWAVLNSLWQMALLWVIFQLITAITRTTKSFQKSLLATTLLFAGFAWFVFTFIVIIADAAPAHNGYAALISINSNQDVKSWLYTMLPVASIVYLVLLSLPILNFIRNYRYVQAVRQYGISKAEVQWRMFVQKVAAQMGITKPVHVWMSAFVTSPVTIGYIKPIILLPVAAINHLSIQQTEAVLLHELSHIKRSDFLINLITKLIQTILYFNPFVKAFAKIIEREREKNCDEIVLQFQYEPHGYASALLELERAGHTSGTLAVAASGEKQNDLITRIESIMGIRKKTAFSFNKLAGIVAALFCFISLNALLLLSKPGVSKSSPGLLTNLSGPFHLFTPGADIKEIAAPVVAGIERVADPVVNYSSSPAQAETQNGTPLLINQKPAIPPPDIPNPSVNYFPFVNVNFVETAMPELNQQEEQQVEEALSASKKVMAEEQWKAMEKNIADAMTSHEKGMLKAEYKKAMSKLDWEKVEEKMRVAYDHINWNQVNTELSNALVEIKLDSLQQAYTTVVDDLSSLQRELAETNECGIPDSEITLKLVEKKKREAKKAIIKLKSVRQRKIIHL
ncbi:MAG: M56 family metallopeptidase [Chitinophagaceae bacterium]